MAKGFLPYALDPRLLLPPDMRAWLPDGQLALFLSDVVEQMDLSAVFADVRQDGRPRSRPFDDGEAAASPMTSQRPGIRRPIACAKSSARRQHATFIECAKRSWSPCLAKSKTREAFAAFSRAASPRCAGEFRFIALTHNLLKLFRSPRRALAFAR